MQSLLMLNSPSDCQVQTSWTVPQIQHISDDSVSIVCTSTPLHRWLVCLGIKLRRNRDCTVYTTVTLETDGWCFASVKELLLGYSNKKQFWARQGWHTPLISAFKSFVSSRTSWFTFYVPGQATPTASRPHLLIVLLHMGQPFKQEHMEVTPIQTTTVIIRRIPSNEIYRVSIGHLL